MDLLEVKSISKTYGSGETAVHALKKVSFSVPKGEYVAIVGESGSGKSTLLKLMQGFYPVENEKIKIYGKDINEYDFMISKIFSENNIELTDYTYTIDNENLVIQINDNITMSDSLKQTLEETVKLNFSVDAMTVNGVDTVLYEKTFVEVN